MFIGNYTQWLLILSAHTATRALASMIALLDRAGHVLNVASQ
jgi:hypothetical protein